MGPLGLLLLRKRLHPNLLVLAPEDTVEHPPLVLDAVPQRQVLTLVHHLLGPNDRHLGVARDGLRRLERALHERLVARERPRRQPPLLRLDARERFARQDELHGLGLADRPGQSLATAGAGDRAQLDLGLAEVGPLRAVEDVGHHGELAAAAQRMTGHGGDDGLLDLGRELRPRLDEALRVGLGEGERRHLLDIRTSSERLLRAGQDDDRDAVRCIEVRQRLVEFID